MRIFRIFRRLLILFFYTLTLYTVYLIGLGLLSLFGFSRASWRNLFMQTWSAGSARILNIRVKKNGFPPSPPFFLVSNHLSYIDIIVLYKHLKCTFVAKKEVRSWPLLGFMVSTTGVIFIDRKIKRDVKRVNKRLSESLNKNQGIVVFPEGTTSGGYDVLPFRAPLLQFPASASMPVHFAAVRYKTDEEKGDPPAEQSVCFYGAREPIHHHLLKLAGNRKIECTIRFGDHPVVESDRKELAAQLRREVSKIFDPMG